VLYLSIIYSIMVTKSVRTPGSCRSGCRLVVPCGSHPSGSCSDRFFLHQEPSFLHFLGEEAPPLSAPTSEGEGGSARPRRSGAASAGSAPLRDVAGRERSPAKLAWWAAGRNGGSTGDAGEVSWRREGAATGGGVTEVRVWGIRGERGGGGGWGY
jgi:hypothetical protein